MSKLFISIGIAVIIFLGFMVFNQQQQIDDLINSVEETQLQSENEGNSIRGIIDQREQERKRREENQRWNDYADEMQRKQEEQDRRMYEDSMERAEEYEREERERYNNMMERAEESRKEYEKSMENSLW